MQGVISTEFLLLNWRDGQTKAERLCAQILINEGFIDLDPQSPIGGPDGRKDILCKKDGVSYIAAVYFPTTQHNFSEIKNKYIHDLEGVEKNNVNGIIFLTNQKLKISERNELNLIAKKEKYKSIIYHLERIRLILDSPIGYGLRLEYLGVKLNQEEQMSFVALLQRTADERLKQQDEKLDRIDKYLKTVSSTVSIITDILQRKGDIPNNSVQNIEIGDYSKNIFGSKVSSALSVNIIQLIHRALLFNSLPENILGKFRNIQVWIMNEKKDEIAYTPSPPENVLNTLYLLIDHWNNNYSKVQKQNRQGKIKALAQFHHGLLSIHPFLDGNSRVAMFVLSQQAFDLFDLNEVPNIEMDNNHINSFISADNGDLTDLIDWIDNKLFPRKK